MSDIGDLPFGLSPLDHVMPDTFAITGGVCMADGCDSPLFIGGHFLGVVVFSHSARRCQDPLSISLRDAVLLCPPHGAGLDELPDDEVSDLRERRRNELRLALTEAMTGHHRSAAPEYFYPRFAELLSHLEEQTRNGAKEIIHSLRQMAASLLRVDREARIVYAGVVEIGSPGPPGSGQVAVSIPVLQATNPAIDDWLLLPGIQGLHHEGLATIYWKGYPPRLGADISHEPHLAVKAPVDVMLAMRAWYREEAGMSMTDVLVPRVARKTRSES